MKKTIIYGVLMILFCSTYLGNGEAAYYNPGDMDVVTYSGNGYYYIDALYSNIVADAFKNSIQSSVDSVTQYKNSAVTSASFCGISGASNINNFHVAFFAGHACPYGPTWHDGGPSSGTISQYYWGYTGRTRWLFIGGCLALYDGVDLYNPESVHWWDGTYPLMRWRPAFHGIHGIIGFRSISFPNIFEPGVAPSRFADYLQSGYTYRDAAFYSTYYYVYLTMYWYAGLEPAVLSYYPYRNERLHTTSTAQAPTHTTNLNYSWWKLGTPIYHL